MPTIGIVGVVLAGKTQTIRALHRRFGGALTSQASEMCRVLSTSSHGHLNPRFVTIPGAVFYTQNIRDLITSSDLLLILVDALAERMEHQREFFESYGPEIRLAPRLYQVNKIDAGAAVPARELLVPLGWTPDQDVFQTCAIREGGTAELVEGIQPWIDAQGPGSRSRAAIVEAFPEQAEDLLAAIDRRWLGWGRRTLVFCPSVDRHVVVRLGPRGAAEVASCREMPFNNEVVPLLSSLRPSPVIPVVRDALLAQLRRALDDAEFDLIESNLAHDVEQREVRCPRCETPFRVRARFDGSDWTFEPQIHPR